MAQTMTRSAQASRSHSIARGAFDRLFAVYRRIRARAATRDALDGLSAEHLRDIGMTPADRDALSGPSGAGLDPEDLARRAGVRAGNW